MGDFNGDGKTDVIQFACNGGSARADVWLSNGTNQPAPGFVPHPSWMYCTGDPSQYLLADVTGDGKTDVIWFAGQGKVGKPHVWVSTGNSL